MPLTPRGQALLDRLTLTGHDGHVICIGSREDCEDMRTLHLDTAQYQRLRVLARFYDALTAAAVYRTALDKAGEAKALTRAKQQREVLRNIRRRIKYYRDAQPVATTRALDSAA